jgi:type I restriction enzyme S subunit
MKSSYKRLGDYIKEVNKRNTELNDFPLFGVSVKKIFIPSIANTVGTDFSKYKIVKRNQFTYIPDTSRRGEKIGLAFLESHDEALVSQAYTVFKVIDENELLPEYLMMWFRRTEFDRYARVKSHGSVREIFDWGEMCDIELPIPSIEKQREIVKEYNVIQNRITLNTQLIAKLEETAQTIYRQWFVEDIDFENLPNEWAMKSLSDFCDIKGGKRLPKGNELNNEKDGNPYIKVADMEKSKFVVLNDTFQYVSKDTQKSISRYIVQTGDIIISIVGTIGLVNMVDNSLNNANLTENCYRLTNFKEVQLNYLYYYLNSPIGKREIESRTVGGVQAKLPMYNVQKLPIVLPDKNLLDKFEAALKPINDLQNSTTRENYKLLEIKNLLLARMTKVESEIETL